MNRSRPRRAAAKQTSPPSLKPLRQNLLRSPVPIALLTDFGAGGIYAGILHGVLAMHAPRARVIDLSHSIPPGSIVAGALALEAAVDYFPAPTVFCCVVDPAVGTERRSLAATDGRHYFLAPDNGLLTLIEEQVRSEGRQWQLRWLELNRLIRLAPPSATFHGRDVFAPAAAVFSRDPKAAFRRLKSPAADALRLQYPRPELNAAAGCARLHTLAADSFGNLITNLRRREWEAFRLGGGGRWHCPEDGQVEVRLGRRRLGGIVRTYANAAPGKPLVYWGSGGRLEIALRDGNAEARFSVVHPAQVVLRWSPRGPTG